MAQIEKVTEGTNSSSASTFVSPRQFGLDGTGWSRLLRGGPIIALLFLLIYFSIASPHFGTLSNFKNIAQQNAYLVILAIGQTLVITGAGIDLSVGAVMAVSASVMAVLATQKFIILGMAIGPINVWLAMLIGLAVGTLAGALTGVVIAKGRIPDFVATLGMMEAARGAALLVTGGLPVPSHLTATELKGYLPQPIIWMGGSEIFGLPTGPLIALAVVVIGWIIMSQTGLGRAIFAVGGNKEAARVSGIKVDRIKIATYTLMGLMAAIAGIVLTGRMNSANALMATGVELKCIAAVVIGGSNLFGGEGTIIGTLIGAIIMGALGNGLNLLNVSAFWQRVIMGIVIVVVVVFDQWRRRRFGT
ncbi:Ribose ABC transport system, permease protein RbsC (TC 3.A.1.2.1) [Olavius sp. associated proteobacterium Delta 1]|nr:Ribose ABC transport system, permease protein RbsC (TC 3.A.1.2.1) [Olavius sp. associated proteobacterium Delta 1]